MPVDERTYRRNSRSTQTEDISKRLNSSTPPPKRSSLFSSVIDFVTKATTTASLEFDHLCESIGIVNRDSESEYEDVTDESEIEDDVEYTNGTYEESEVDDLEITPSKPSTIGRNELKIPAAAKASKTVSAARVVRRWSPPRTHTIVTKEETSSEEDQWKPPDVMAQVRRINERLKQNGAYEFKKAHTTPDYTQPTRTFVNQLGPIITESAAHAAKQVSPIKPAIQALPRKSLSPASRHTKELVGIIKTEPVESALAIKDHILQTNEAPEQAPRRVTFASPDKSERDRLAETPSSQLHLYNLQLERERVERLEKELANVKAKVETLSALSPKTEKEEIKNQSVVSHEKFPEDALPSPSTSPSHIHRSEDRKQRYSPIMARPTPLIQVPPNVNTYSLIKLKATNTLEGSDDARGVRRPNDEMKKVLLQIPEVKLRQANLIKQPDGTFIVNKFWNEIYNHPSVQNQAQATTSVATTASLPLIPDKCSNNSAMTAEQTDLSTTNTKRKYSVLQDDNRNQYDHSHAKVSKLS